MSSRVSFGKPHIEYMCSAFQNQSCCCDDKSFKSSLHEQPRSTVSNVEINCFKNQKWLQAYVDEAAPYRGACSGPERGTQEFCRQQYHREFHPPEYWTEFTSDKSVKVLNMFVRYEWYPRFCGIDNIRGNQISRIRVKGSNTQIFWKWYVLPLKNFCVFSPFIWMNILFRAQT